MASSSVAPSFVMRLSTTCASPILDLPVRPGRLDEARCRFVRQAVDGAGNCSGFGKGVDSQGNQVQWRLFVASTGVCQTDIRRHESQNFCHQGVAAQIPASKKAMPDITMSELANAIGLSVADEKKTPTSSSPHRLGQWWTLGECEPPHLYKCGGSAMRGPRGTPPRANWRAWQARMWTSRCRGRGRPT